MKDELTDHKRAKVVLTLTCSHELGAEMNVPSMVAMIPL